MRKILVLLLIIAFFATAGAVFASNKYGKAVTPPFPQPAEKDLQKVVFIRYAPGFQKDKPCDYDGVCDPDEKGWCVDCKGGEPSPTPTPTPTPSPEPSACYAFLSGAKPKWNWVEDYYSTDSALLDASLFSVDKWESVTGEIFRDRVNEFYPWGVYDYHNAVTYDNYPEVGVLAVTAIWFRGKNIYEYDIMFDTDYFPNKGYDLYAVALHEFGHGAGLDDLYDTVCSNEVMYWLYEEGKTTLGAGDTTGIQTLYGK